VLVAVGATVPQKLMAQETGTVPIIGAPSKMTLSNVKDNGTVPIIGTPSNPDPVAPPPGGTPDDATITLEITVNAPTTVDTPLTLETDHPELIGLPSTAIVSAGNSTTSVTVTVTPGYAEHHRHVKMFISSNGTTVETKIRVHYQGEID
jgi:hypothetical protein